MSVRIVIADDHKIVRDGLRQMLSRQLDFEVIAEAEDGLEAIRLAEELRPDVVLMDVGMKGLNGVEATRRLLASVPSSKVLGLSMHSEKRFVREMLAAGASGYMHKDCAFDELADAIRAVTEGRTYLSPRVAETVVQDYLARVSSAREADDDGAAAVLSSREREVLQLLAEGKSAKEAGGLLKISVKTVETHRRQIMSKLGIYSIAGLTKYAIREGLTSTD